jgi:hypothetical protein
LKSQFSREIEDALKIISSIEESKKQQQDSEAMKKKQEELVLMAQQNEKKHEEEEEKRLEEMREKEKKIAKLQQDLEGAMESRDAELIHWIMDEEILVDEEVRVRLESVAVNFVRNIDTEKAKLEKLAEAMGQFDRAKMKKLLSEIDIAAVSKIKEVESLVIDAQRMCYILSEKEIFCLQLQAAFQKQDVDKCEKLVEEATMSGIDDEQVRAVSLWISQQKLKSQKIENAAVKNFSAVVDASQEKALSDYFWKLRASYPLRFHPLLREPGDFSKSLLFGSKVKKYMLQWQEVKFLYCSYFIWLNCF